jgi:branched-chain amino acid transport system substrate-binding protein
MLIFCTGPVPAQQLDPFIPWLMQQTGARKFYLPSADYILPHVMNKKVREIVTANGGTIEGEVLSPQYSNPATQCESRTRHRWCLR